MSEASSRRDFLRTGTVAAVGALGAGAGAATAQETPRLQSPAADQPTPATTPPPVDAPAHAAHQNNDEVRDEYDGFSRFKPSRGLDPDSPYYLGKLVPGFRPLADGPAPFVAPDVEKLSLEMKNGAKEFHLRCTPVSREFLPGTWINCWGFNGSLPGPTIEINQGDRVRIVVHNELPEDTSVHWHGFELPVQYDGSDTLTQNPIKPGKSFTYEFDVHEEGTFFYHTHVAMQETHGMVGWFIVHPQRIFDPPVDRDFGLIFQNFRVNPMQTVVDSWDMDFNWHTINGRSGPFSTPLVVKHGERVRIRILDFSPVQHHPIHIHGHTFWITGHEGARIPKSAWVCRNTELIGVAQATNFEFIANNPGDWMFHCHMTHHMMNHMVQHVGPRLRPDSHVNDYLTNLESRPRVKSALDEPGFQVPGYPQGMKGMEMSMEFMNKIWSRREFMGMRATAPMSLMGLMTALRVLPDDLYHRVMETDEKIEKGAIFQEIVNRFGTPADYKPAPPDAMQKHMLHGM